MLINTTFFVASKRPKLSIQVKSSGTSPLLQQKVANPRVSSQSILPDSGYDGLSKVTINGDSNLVSSNIKSRTSIFGVSGTLSSTLKSMVVDVQPNYYVENNMVYVDFTESIDTSKIFCISYAFYLKTNNTSVNIGLRNTALFSKTTSSRYTFSSSGGYFDRETTSSSGAITHEYLAAYNGADTVYIYNDNPNRIQISVSSNVATLNDITKGGGDVYGGKLYVYYYE